MPKSIVMIDSSVGVSKSEANKLGLGFVPLMLIDQNNKSYPDNKIDFSDEKLFESLKTNIWKTSQANPFTLREVIEELLKSYQNVIYLTIPKEISGQFENATNLSNSEELKGRLHVFDCSAIAYQTLLVAQHISKIVCNLEKIDRKIIEKELTNYYGKLDAYFSPFDIKYLKNGGRISAAKAFIGMLFQIKPVFSYNPLKKDVVAKVRTESKVYETIVEFINKSIISKKMKKNDLNFLLLHTFTDKTKIDFAVKNLEKLLDVKVQPKNMPATIACHIGYDSFGCMFLPKSL